MAFFCNEFEDAVVASIIRKWRLAGGRKLGRTILQKLTYFVKAKGVPVSFDFELYHYGPFSQELSERVDWLQIDSIIEDKGQSNESNYALGPRADEVIISYSDKLQSIDFQIDQVINSFFQKTPKDMELLATVHFVQQSGGPNKDISRTIREVRRIKGNKFSEDEIRVADKYLNSEGF